MSGPLGVDPGRSILYAQVTDSDPRMAFDEEGFMHRIGTRGSFGKAYLGDVTRVALQSMGSHGPPKFTKLPRIDEQNWEMDCSTDSLRVKIASKHYWGFGLFSRCFLNEITIEGEDAPVWQTPAGPLNIGSTFTQSLWLDQLNSQYGIYSTINYVTYTVVY